MFFRLSCFLLIFFVSNLLIYSNPKIEKLIIENYPKYPLFYNNSYIFVYETNENIKNIAFVSNINNFSEKDFLKKIEKTNLYYKIVNKNKIDQSFVYYYIINYNDKSKISRDQFNETIKFEKKILNTINLTPSKKGTLNIISKIEPESKNISARDIIVYLPPNYYDSKEKFPVLYMQDGQQIWDSPACAHGGWKMDTIADRLINENKIKPIIIVGIYNTPKRNDEYMGWSKYHQKNQTEVKDKVDNESLVLQIAVDYENYIIEKIKPLIDSKYRTLSDRDNTGVGGSSSGAMEALYLTFKRNEVFSKCAALSGGEKYYIDLINDYLPLLKIEKFDTKIYLDCGDLDLDKRLLPETIAMYEALIKKGFTEKNLLYRVAKNRGHNEKAWSERVEDFLIFLFGK